MALLGSYFPESMNPNDEDFIRTEIKDSLKGMQLDEIKAFSDNVSAIIELIDKTAQDVITVKKIGYDPVAKAKLDELTETKKAEEAATATFQRNLEAYDAKKAREAQEKKAKEDSRQIKKFEDSLNSQIKNIRSDIGELESKNNRLRDIQIYDVLTREYQELDRSITPDILEIYRQNPAIVDNLSKIDILVNSKLKPLITEIVNRLDELKRISTNISEILPLLIEKTNLFLDIVGQRLSNISLMKKDDTRDLSLRVDKMRIIELKTLYDTEIKERRELFNEYERRGFLAHINFKKTYQKIDKLLGTYNDELNKIYKKEIDEKIKENKEAVQKIGRDIDALIKKQKDDLFNPPKQSQEKVATITYMDAQNPFGINPQLEGTPTVKPPQFAGPPEEPKTGLDQPIINIEEQHFKEPTGLPPSSDERPRLPSIAPLPEGQPPAGLPPPLQEQVPDAATLSSETPVSYASLLGRLTHIDPINAPPDIEAEKVILGILKNDIENSNIKPIEKRTIIGNYNTKIENIKWLTDSNKVPYTIIVPKSAGSKTYRTRNKKSCKTFRRKQ